MGLPGLCLSHEWSYDKNTPMVKVGITEAAKVIKLYIEV